MEQRMQDGRTGEEAVMDAAWGRLVAPRDPLVEDEDGNIDTYWQRVVAEDESPLYELERRKGLDCE
jgi:hypothetical protein